MSEHLSALVLDSLAAGLPVEADAQAHADGCAQCSAAVVARRAASAAFLARPEARRRLGILQSQVVVAAERPAMAWWVKVLAFAVPVAVAFALVLRLGSPGDKDRVKGAAELTVLFDGGVVTSVPAGSAVTLALGGGGAAYAAVLSVDEQGGVDIVWPVQGERSMRVEGGAREKLAEFQVTPGSVTLRAFLTNEPMALQELLRAMPDGGVAGARTVSMHLEVTP